MSVLSIEPMTPADWPEVRRIYEEGIASGHATFETSPPTWDAFNDAHHAEPRLVARSADTLRGWAALSPVSRREVYAGVAEVSVYVSAVARGKGIGRALLNELVVRSEAAGIWTLQAGVFPENVASVQLHEACGFKVVGTRERIGRLHGRWRDVLLLERRSPQIGS